MEIVKTSLIEKQFRYNSRTKTNVYVNTMMDLKPGESLVLTAKETDKWKNPSTILRSFISYAKAKKKMPRNLKFSVKCLKSGSYAVVRISE